MLAVQEEMHVMSEYKNKSINNNYLNLSRKSRYTSKTFIKKQRAFAKLGMIGSLGTLLVSGFLKFQKAKSLHIYSGFGLLAFSLWHHRLNQPKTRLKQ
jgi:hypothetical protein